MTAAAASNSATTGQHGGGVQEEIENDASDENDEGDHQHAARSACVKASCAISHAAPTYPASYRSVVEGVPQRGRCRPGRRAVSPSALEQELEDDDRDGDRQQEGRCQPPHGREALTCCHRILARGPRGLRLVRPGCPALAHRSSVFRRSPDSNVKRPNVADRAGFVPNLDKSAPRPHVAERLVGTAPSQCSPHAVGSGAPLGQPIATRARRGGQDLAVGQPIWAGWTHRDGRTAWDAAAGSVSGISPETGLDPAACGAGTRAPRGVFPPGRGAAPRPSTRRDWTQVRFGVSSPLRGSAVG